MTRRCYIKKELLHLDPTYQREPIRSRVAKFAREWDPDLAGTLTVNFRRSDGRYYIVDGGHRHAAAMKVSSVESLSCNILELETSTDEARYFGMLNTSQKKPSPVEMHKALVEAREPTAMGINSIIVSNGYRVMNGDSKWNFRAVTELSKIYSSSEDAAAQSFSLAADLARGEQITHELLRGIYGLSKLGNYYPFSGKHRGRILSAGYRIVMFEIQTSIATQKNRRKLYACAHGIALAANKGYRSHKFVLEDFDI